MTIDYVQIIEAIVIVLGYIVAYLKTREVKNVQNFFDPASPVTKPPKNTPTRSYKMSDSVKQLLISGESKEDQGWMLKQVEDAEDAGKLDYIVYSSRGHYKIQYGQIRGW